MSSGRKEALSLPGSCSCTTSDDIDAIFSVVQVLYGELIISLSSSCVSIPGFACSVERGEEGVCGEFSTGISTTFPIVGDSGTGFVSPSPSVRSSFLVQLYQLS